MDGEETAMSRTPVRPPLAELNDALSSLRTRVSDPFGLFVAEGLRGLGIGVTDPAPADDLLPDIYRALGAYERAVLEAEPFRDLLGPIYMEQVSRSKAQVMGQFFTPWEVSELTAGMLLVDWCPERKPDGGLWTLQEPACGSGAMLLATFSHLVRAHGASVLHMWSATAIDKDLVMARTCALQIYATLAAQGWGIGEMVVLWGDTLRLEMFGTVVHSKVRPEMAQLTRMMEALLSLAPGDAEEPETVIEPAAPPSPAAAIPPGTPLLLAPAQEAPTQTDLFGAP
jgi:hypothetical protein